MTSITCSTCGTQVSEPATECPECGTPTGFAPPEKPKRQKYAYIGAGVAAAVVILALILFAGRDKPAEKPAAAVTKAPPPEAPKAAVPKPPPLPQQPVAKAPPAEAAKPSPHGVYFLVAYTPSNQIRELRPVVAPDENAMNEVVRSATGALVFKPLGLACGPDRGPNFAWVVSKDPTPQPNFRVGAACGFTSPVAAAEKAIEGCRESGGCQKTDAEIHLYAGDIRDGAGEEWRAKPRLWCQLAAGNIVNAWQYIPEKRDFNQGCVSLLAQ